MLHPDYPIFPTELLYLLAFLFIELAIVCAFVRYLMLWLWAFPLHLA